MKITFLASQYARIGGGNRALFEYANMYAEKKLDQFKTNHIKHIFLVIFILTIFIIATFIVGPFFYELWLNNKFELGNTLLLLIIIDVSIQILKKTITTVMKSLNWFFKINLIETLFVLTAVITSYFLLSAGYSFLSFFISILISSLIILLVSIYMLNYFYKEKIFKK